MTPHEIEGLFAADLAFLQDFYGVINFGNQEEFEALVAAQAESAAAGRRRRPRRRRPSTSRTPRRGRRRGAPTERSAAPPAHGARVEEIPPRPGG